MGIQSYSAFQSDKKRKKRRIMGSMIIVLILLAGLYVLGIFTSDSPEYQIRENTLQENHVLKEQIAELEAEVKSLRAELKELRQTEPSTVGDDGELPETPRDGE